PQLCQVIGRFPRFSPFSTALCEKPIKKESPYPVDEGTRMEPSSAVPPRPRKGEPHVSVAEAPAPAGRRPESGRPGDDLAAVRLQVAAVAAQQVALSEQEARLVQRQGALEQQEEQLAGHLEEKRRKIHALHERVKVERAALRDD